jgi:glycosyltransferase involved in cell wall biosynthesis
VNRIDVVGQDPRFGGGALAHMQAFVVAASELGFDPELHYVPQPALRPELHSSPLDRIEVVRIVRGGRQLALSLGRRRPLWVVAPLATHGYAALRTGRSYAAWVGTSLADENRGRLHGLPPSRALALRVNAPALARVERAVLRGAKRVYATSPATRTAVARAARLDEAAIGILPLPADIERFTPEPDHEWLRHLERPVLAIVGRADDPRKNVGLALAALPLIRQRVPGTTIRLIGRPPSGELPAGVEVLGQVDSVTEHLRDASLLLLPSRQEGFGIVAAEALAAGVPVVATPSGGPEDLLTRSAGGIVLSGWEPSELADTAVELLGDVARLTAMRRCGREYVAREHSPERLRELLNAAIAETR